MLTPVLYGFQIPIFSCARVFWCSLTSTNHATAVIVCSGSGRCVQYCLFSIYQPSSTFGQGLQTQQETRNSRQGSKLCQLVCRQLRPIHLRPFIWDHFIWDHFIWDPAHLRPIHLRSHSYETTFIWEHIHLRPRLLQITFILRHVKVKLFWFTVNHIFVICLPLLSWQPEVFQSDSAFEVLQCYVLPCGAGKQDIKFFDLV